MRYRFVAIERASFPVRMLCRLVGAAVSGFYAWLRRGSGRHRETDRRLGERIGAIFAAHSSVVWNAARRDEQFQRALASRDVIGQAKGMIMERYGVDAVQAFELLRKLSQDSNVPLIQIATELVAKAQSKS